jgi:hypothetical protein
MSSGVLAAYFSPERLSARLPRPGSWHPYPAIPDRAAWDTVHPAIRDHVLAQAARLLASPWPVLTASDYARFSGAGDRQTYERPYFARRSRLAAAVLTAAPSRPSPGTHRRCPRRRTAAVRGEKPSGLGHDLTDRTAVQAREQSPREVDGTAEIDVGYRRSGPLAGCDHDGPLQVS